MPPPTLQPGSLALGFSHPVSTSIRRSDNYRTGLPLFVSIAAEHEERCHLISCWEQRLPQGCLTEVLPISCSHCVLLQ